METRRCERCGTEFVPKREHARFCSARCRVAWNRENWNRINRDKQTWSSEGFSDDSRGASGTEASALGWALVAMRDTTEQLGKVRAGDRGQAFAVIGEAVWWVTIVDATLIRYHPDEYETALTRLAAGQRRVTEGTFTGLRFVRNRMGYYADHADFIQPCRDSDGQSDAPITLWSWRSLPPPMVATLPPRGQEWEMSRYQAYQDRLAGHPVGETFSRASAFLDLVARAAEEGAADPGTPDTPAAPGGAVAGGRAATGQ
jgi:endogenous inhibitor of DNA gyrase (YacG/DUF329 family)